MAYASGEYMAIPKWDMPVGNMAILQISYASGEYMAIPQMCYASEEYGHSSNKLYQWGIWPFFK
jgi:hypothetical protein